MKRTDGKLSEQMERKHKKEQEAEPKDSKQVEYDGDDDNIISTGSTLLDLAISGGRFREGGIPAGILVEIFGPSSAGKTVLLCQLAGTIQKMGGDIMFHDPEARLDKQFARMFGLRSDDIEYTTPDTVTETFKSVREWLPTKDEETPDDEFYGIFADSLAALSTNLEMDNEEGDKMGMRRAKEFSEELRKTCRIIAQRNILMVCSNQIRQNVGGGLFSPKYKSPGGEALGFYSSLRLRCSSPAKIKKQRTVRGKKHERVIGIKVRIEIHKSSVWKPYHDAEVYILYDYGIDDIRGNLRFLKTSTGSKNYKIGDTDLGHSITRAIKRVEKEGLEDELKQETIDVWNEIEEKFASERKPRMW